MEPDKSTWQERWDKAARSMSPDAYEKWVAGFIAEKGCPLEIIKQLCAKTEKRTREELANALYQHIIKLRESGWIIGESFALLEIHDFLVARPSIGDEPEGAREARLRKALKPFANYACDPPCGCHNCEARAALTAEPPGGEKK